MAAPLTEFTYTKLDEEAGKLNILLEAEDTPTLTACKVAVNATDCALADKLGQYVYDVEIYMYLPSEGSTPSIGSIKQ